MVWISRVMDWRVVILDYLFLVYVCYVGLIVGIFVVWIILIFVTYHHETSSCRISTCSTHYIHL